MKRLFMMFWDEMTVTCGNHKFEMGGWLISMGITMLILWAFGAFN